jgi:hypothetical protein
MHPLHSTITSLYSLVLLQAHISQLLLQTRYSMCLLLLLLPCLEIIITTQASQSLVGALKTLIRSDSCKHSTHSMVIASLSLI